MVKPPLAIVHAQLEPRECPGRNSSYPTSTSLQKLLLLIIAAHEHEVISTHQLAALAGVSVAAATSTLHVLMDVGLVVREICPRDQPSTFPVAHKGPTYAYGIVWSAVCRLPRTRMPKSCREAKGCRTEAVA